MLGGIIPKQKWIVKPNMNNKCENVILCQIILTHAHGCDMLR